MKINNRLLNSVINRNRTLINNMVISNRAAREAFPEYSKPENPYYESLEDAYNDCCFVLKYSLEADYSNKSDEFIDALILAILDKFDLPIPYKFLQ